MIYKEHDVVSTTKDIERFELEAGDIGTIVHVHHKPKLAYEVDFSNKYLDFRDYPVYTLQPEEIKIKNKADH